MFPARSEIKPETLKVQFQPIDVIAVTYFAHQLQVVLAHFRLLVVQAVAGSQSPLGIRFPDCAMAGMIGPLRGVTVVHAKGDPCPDAITACTFEHPFGIVATLFMQLPHVDEHLGVVGKWSGNSPWSNS